MKVKKVATTEHDPQHATKKQRARIDRIAQVQEII
jgi:hypothetical protein